MYFLNKHALKNAFFVAFLQREIPLKGIDNNLKIGYNNYATGDVSLGKEVYDTAHPDLMINCLFILALENLRVITERIGKAFRYAEVLKEIKINA